MPARDPGTPPPGGGDEGLREALCETVWLQTRDNPGSALSWSAMAELAERHPACVGAGLARAVRTIVDALVAGPLADTLARAGQAEAAERDIQALRRVLSGVLPPRLLGEGQDRSPSDYAYTRMTWGALAAARAALARPQDTGART